MIGKSSAPAGLAIVDAGNGFHVQGHDGKRLLTNVSFDDAQTTFSVLERPRSADTAARNRVKDLLAKGTPAGQLAGRTL
jgi:hypothetical protein